MLLSYRAGHGPAFASPPTDRPADRLRDAFCKGALAFLFLLLAACGGGGGGVTGGSGAPGGGSAALVSISLAPAFPSLEAGKSLNLVATGSFSDSASRDVSGEVNWTSSAPEVATVAAGGVISGAAAGTTTITARSGAISATVTVTVIPRQATVTHLYNFAGSSGPSQPNGPLLQASDGNFYGTSRAGGSYACRGGGFPCGTVFRMTPSGAVTVLYAFGASETDAFGPSGPLIQGSDGALYGVTAYGGTHGSGTVFRVTLAGNYAVLHSFGGSPTAGIVPTGRLLQASDGNFYGATGSGGAYHCFQIPQAGSNCGTIFRMTPTGVVTTLYSFGANTSDGVQPNGSLIQGSDGNLYGTTSNGGANTCSLTGGRNDCGTVFRITTAGALTILHNFGTTFADGIAPQGPLLQASDGNFYGTTASGGGGRCGWDYGCGTVFKITPGGNVTIVWAFSLTTRTDGDGPAPFLIQAQDGNFYGTTRSGGAAQASSTGTVFRLTPSGAKSVIYSFGTAADREFDPDSGVIQASDGAFYGMTRDTVFRLIP